MKPRPTVAADDLNGLYAFLTQTIGSLGDVRGLEVTPILSSVKRTGLLRPSRSDAASAWAGRLDEAQRLAVVQVAATGTTSRISGWRWTDTLPDYGSIPKSALGLDVSEGDAAVDVRGGGAADPDGAVRVGGDLDGAGPAHACALGDPVGGGGGAGGGEPLPD